jgi:phosphoribosyl 1,2-cyclic phosphodiesterase
MIFSIPDYYKKILQNRRCLRELQAVDTLLKTEWRGVFVKVCVLASGSSGNCIYVGSGENQILIDAGISCKETERRLVDAGLEPEAIQAICITHEHEDHVAAIGVMQRKRGVGLYANSATIEAINAAGKRTGLTWNVFEAGQAFEIGDLTLEPFSVPHDAYDPVGFRISDGQSKIGIVTDMGMATGLVREKLKNCSVIVIESNHDSEMLKQSGRPWSLKQRIAGRHGHMSNVQACELLDEIATDSLKAVYLAHISSDCNERDIALRKARSLLEAKNLSSVSVEPTYASRATGVMEF